MKGRNHPGRPVKSRHSRSLNTQDAIFVGLSSMIGAGIFTALAPAEAAAQTSLIFGLIIAACVAHFNASASAGLARLYPASGGTYVYAKKRLNRFWGRVASGAFITGKLASCTAVALTFGYYFLRTLPATLLRVAVNGPCKGRVHFLRTLPATLLRGQ